MMLFAIAIAAAAAVAAAVGFAAAVSIITLTNNDDCLYWRFATCVFYYLDIVLFLFCDTVRRSSSYRTCSMHDLLFLFLFA
jgi:hypothetical protein